VYIIIIGGGRVGYYLSKALLDEGHEILVIEKDAAKVEHIEEDLGSICMQGDGCEAATLEEAGTERAGLFIAVTNEDEDNLVACQVAKHKFNVPRIVARIGNPKNETLFKKLGIDVTISTTKLILEYIGQEVPTHPLMHLLELKKGELEVVEVKISSTSVSVGKQIRELNLPPGSVLSLIVRESGVQVPTKETILEADDRVIAVTRPDLEKDLRNVLIGG
jgi:trk system potassium uptake protein TrkA